MERSGLVLQVGQIATVNIALPIAAQAQRIDVVEAAPIVDTGRAAVGAVVTRVEIENLPINGRNFLDYSRTVAGVTAQQTSGQGSGLSFNGQRGRSNNISIDGVDNNGQLNGNTRLTMSQEAVREFQVSTSQFAPEFGQAGGGMVNVVSRSGGNDFHGDVFFFIRNEALDGRNAFATGPDKPPFHRKNSGATLGGPILRNRTFFFGGIEYVKRNESDIVTISSANVAAINATLAARPIPNAGVRAIASGPYPIDRITTLGSLKIDHSINPNNALMFRYIFGQGRESNAGGVSVGGITDLSGGGGQRTRDQSFVGGFTHVFSPALLSESRFQFAPRRLTQYANDPIGPRVTISGVANFGRDVNFPVLLDGTRYQWQESASKQAGAHFLKFGADINFLRAHTSFPVSFAGTFTFASLADFVAGRVNQYSQGFGNPEIRLPETLLGFYAQDSYRASRKLTLTFGVRYDYDRQPQGIPRDRMNPIEGPLQDGIHRDGNNLAPRFGLAYNSDGAGKTVIHSGYGIFYDKIFLLVARNALLARQTLTLTAAQGTARLPLGAFPQSASFPTGFALPKPSLNTVDPNIVLPYAQQADLGVERAVATDVALGINYVLVRGSKLIRSQNINLGPPTVLTAQNAAALGVAAPNPQQIGRIYFGAASRINPDSNNIQQVSSSSSSTYHGMQLTLQKRFSHGLQLRANYTFSKAIDDTSDFVQAQQPSNPYNARAERSLSIEDQRHRFTMTGVWEIWRQWVLSTSWVFRSGTPQNVRVGSDVNGDGNATDRPFHGVYELGRNTLEGPGSAVVDVRLARRIRIGERMTVQILGEAFNIQNRVNYGSDINTTWGTAIEPRSTLGAYQSADIPRQIQLGLKFTF